MVRPLLDSYVPSPVGSREPPSPHGGRPLTVLGARLVCVYPPIVNTVTSRVGRKCSSGQPEMLACI